MSTRALPGSAVGGRHHVGYNRRRGLVTVNTGTPVITTRDESIVLLENAVLGFYSTTESESAHAGHARHKL